MGLATLNVWIHDQQDTCKISNGSWLVSVTYCNGEAVEWCGHTFLAEPAKCGHAEFQLPPGCYVVCAFQWIPFKPFPLFFFTEHAIVIVGCDEFACVHLFTPTYRQSIGQPGRAARFIAELQKLPADKVDKFVAAGEELLKAMPQTAADNATESMLQQLAEFLKNNPPEGGGAKS
jgi:hypothetical protein